MKNKGEFDENLWFIHKCCKEKHYLTGNSRFFHGKVYAWCPKKSQSIYVSISEIGSMSIFCNYWINGYLSGSTPNAPTNTKGDIDFLGDEYKKWENSSKINY